jgi:hypothetical protein
MSKQPAYRYDVFISSSPTDRIWVDTILVPRLRAADLTIMVSDSVLVLDVQARAELAEQIEQAEYILAVLSPDSLQNQQARFERDQALERNFREGVFCLLPIQIAPLDRHQIPKQLASLTTVDFTQPAKVEDAFAQLLWMWEEP